MAITVIVTVRMLFNELKQIFIPEIYEDKGPLNNVYNYEHHSLEHGTKQGYNKVLVTGTRSYMSNIFEDNNRSDV